jgi:4,5-dihydroxyphthalate decarboxylase
MADDFAGPLAAPVPDTPAITIAVGDYDHTRDLVADEELRRLPAAVIAIDTPEELFGRFLSGEFDVAEMSLAVTAARRAAGDSSLVPLPIFPARSFRHAAIYVRTAGVREANDLNGRRVGIPAWAQTAGVYARGMLTERYGVDLTTIEWVQAGVDEPGRREPVVLDLGPFDVQPAPGHSLDELLRNGDVDAVISARPPQCFERGDPEVRRLFSDPMDEEAQYFRDTGVFPIMHVVVARRAAVERVPGMAAVVTAAFERAKGRSLERLGRATVPSAPLPWTSFHLRDARTLMGNDPWPYGIEPNRPALATFLRYASEQRVCARPLTIAELF